MKKAVTISRREHILFNVQLDDVMIPNTITPPPHTHTQSSQTCVHTLTWKFQALPWNSGQTFQIEMTPSLANWPNDSSMKKSGRPANISMNVYGMRNAPENYHQT